MLTGKYAADAKRTYKTVEGKNLLAAVRHAIKLIDEEMKKPSTFERGQRIGKITADLELATDLYDLFGENDRRRKPNEKTTNV